MIKRNWDLLFFEYDLDAVLRAQLESVEERVTKIPPATFESTSDEFLAASVASDLVVAPLRFHEESISVSSRDAKIDVSHDFSRGGFGEGPVNANGLEVTYHLPFSGDRQLLKCRPNPFDTAPPRAVIASSELRFPYDQPDANAAATKKDFLEDLGRVKKWAGWVNNQVDAYNGNLETAVRSHVQERRTALQRRKTDIQSLGYPVRPDPLAGPTVALPDPSTLDPTAKRKATRTRARRQYDVALSFAGEDRPYVEQVAQALASLGVTVFYDKFEQVNLWGADLAAHLGNVYGRDSRFVVLFLSRDYAAKAWPTHEKSFALGRHLKGDTGRILPVRFDETVIEGLPPTMGYLDLRALTPTKLAELIRQKVDSPDSDA